MKTIIDAKPRSDKPGRTLQKLSSLTCLIQYPDEISRCTSLVLLDDLGIGEDAGIVRFRDHLRDSSIEDLQEYYTRTFEVNPVCSLEIGWQLYGEQYERGLLMTKLRSAMRGFDLDEGTELPDHLSNVLTLLDALPGEAAALLAGSAVIPALRAMHEGFMANKRVADSVMDLTLKKRDRLLLEKDSEEPSRNLYATVLELILRRIEAIAGVEEVESVIPRQKNFIPPWESEGQAGNAGGPFIRKSPCESTCASSGCHAAGGSNER